jgi:hypothetical protein
MYGSKGCFVGAGDAHEVSDSSFWCWRGAGLHGQALLVVFGYEREMSSVVERRKLAGESGVYIRG